MPPTSVCLAGNAKVIMIAHAAPVHALGEHMNDNPHPTYIALVLFNPDKGFSGCGLETIAELKVALGLERVDLVGGNGCDDVNEGIDDGSMPGQIEGRELLDMADVGHVPGIEQGFIV